MNRLIFYYLVVPSTNIFTIDSTGKIQASGSLDRESISSYAVVIKVSGANLFLFFYLEYVFSKAQ